MAAKEKEELVKKDEGENLVQVIIDPKLTNGGLRTITSTGVKRYVGKVKVPADLAEDLLRRQTEYAATIQKLNEPSLEIRNQSIGTSYKAFMADPAQHGKNPGFSRETGLLSRFQWEFISDKDKEEWKEERMGLFGY
jgi:predicted RNA-binding Zn ribbon-like protein